MSTKIVGQLKTELLNSFKLYADSEYTDYTPLRPVSKIVFSAQGEITTPPDLEFMGYGVGSEGESFHACGGIDLETFFPLDAKGEYFVNDDEEHIEACIQKAGVAVLAALKSVATSDEFYNIPKEGPIVFALDLMDQTSKVLCRIHEDGKVELPPKK